MQLTIYPPLYISIGVGAFVIGLGQISSFFCPVIWSALSMILHSREGPGGIKSRMCTPYPQRVVKGDLLGHCVGITV